MPTDPQDPPSSSRKGAAWWFEQHLATAVSAAVLLTVLAKLYVVAHGNTTSALAPLRYLGPANIAIGTVLSSMPIAIFLGSFWSIQNLSEAVAERDENKSAAALPLVAMAVLGVLVLPWPLLASLGVLAVTFALTTPLRCRWTDRREQQRGRNSYGRQHSVGLDIGVLVVLLWLGFIAYDAPWLPPERLTQPGRQAFVGYVVSEEPLLALRSRDRVVVRLAPQTRRILCSKSAALRGRSVILLLFGADDPQYPGC